MSRLACGKSTAAVAAAEAAPPTVPMAMELMLSDGRTIREAGENDLVCIAQEDIAVLSDHNGFIQCALASAVTLDKSRRDYILEYKNILEYESCSKD